MYTYVSLIRQFKSGTILTQFQLEYVHSRNFRFHLWFRFFFPKIPFQYLIQSILYSGNDLGTSSGVRHLLSSSFMISVSSLNKNYFITTPTNVYFIWRFMAMYMWHNTVWRRAYADHLKVYWSIGHTHSLYP